MKFLGIPTDNLYKFMALSGVVIAIANTYFYVSKVSEYKDELLKHRSEIEFIAPITEWGAALGTVFAVLGFSLWYFRHQRPVDQTLEARAKLAMCQAESALAKSKSPTTGSRRRRR